MTKRISIFAIYLSIFLPVISFAESNKLDSLIQTLKFEKQDTVRYSTLSKIAIAYADSNYNKSLEYWKQALSLADKEGLREQAADAYHQVGFTYMKMGEMNQALQNLQNAADIYSYLNKKSLLAGVYNDIGLIHRNWGLYDKALQDYFNALNIYNEISDVEGTSMVSNNIGQIYYYREDYPKAIDYFVQYYNVNKKLGHVRSVAGASNNIASAYMELKRYDDALEYFMESLKIYDSIGLKIGVAIIRDNIGSLFYKKGQYDHALLYHLSALNIFKELQSPVRIANTMRNIGDVYIKLNRKSEAINTLQQALEIAQKIGIADTRRDIYKVLSNAYQSQGNYRQAFESLNNYISIKDSLLNIETLEKVESLQAQYERDKLENQIASIKQKAHNQKLILFLTIGFSAILLIMLVFLVTQVISKKRLVTQHQLIKESILNRIQTSCANLEIVSQDPTVNNFFSNTWQLIPKEGNTSFEFYYFRKGAYQIAYAILTKKKHIRQQVLNFCIYNHIQNFLHENPNEIEKIKEYVDEQLKADPLTLDYAQTDYEILPFVINDKKILNLTNGNFALRQHGVFLYVDDCTWSNLHKDDIVYLFSTVSNEQKGGISELRKVVKSLDLIEFTEQLDVAQNFLTSLELDADSIILSLIV